MHCDKTEKNCEYSLIFGHVYCINYGRTDEKFSDITTSQDSQADIYLCTYGIATHQSWQESEKILRYIYNDFYRKLSVNNKQKIDLPNGRHISNKLAEQRQICINFS